MAEKQDWLREMIRNKADRRSAEITAALKPFLERPGARTCYEAEKALHELTRKMADDIFAEVMASATRDQAFIESAVQNAEKKGGDVSTTGDVRLMSSSGEAES